MATTRSETKKEVLEQKMACVQENLGTLDKKMDELMEQKGLVEQMISGAGDQNQ